MKIDCHRRIGRVVVHIAHYHTFDSGILLHHLHRVIIDNLPSASTGINTLSSDTGRKVADIESEMFAVNYSMDHEDVSGTEISLLLLVHIASRSGCTVEGERNRLSL